MEDIKLVQKIKEMVNNFPYLSLPLDSDYLVIECEVVRKDREPS